MPSPRELAEYIYAQDNLDRLKSDQERYMIYNGKIRDFIRDAIKAEFLLPETVRELQKRIIPLNLTQKIVNKLSGVYRDTPVRTAKDDDENDNESIAELTDILDINSKMKDANRMFKLAKRVALEGYLSSRGEPSMRVLPSHTFTVYSDDALDPQEPTHIIKHLILGKSKTDDRHVVWSDLEHYTMNGEGQIIIDENNPDLVNPYGINPITYIKEGMELQPIQDDDLLYMQIAICLLLTDLAFATKYLAWSVIYIIGADTKKLSFNPNSVINLPIPKGSDQKPEIGTVTPKVATDDLLRQVEALVGLLLTTKNLSIGTVSIKLGSDAQQATSGVAKILDSAESTEDQNDQQAYFICAEEKFWMKYALQMSYWTKNNMVAPDLINNFSDTFELALRFKDPTPQTSELVKIQTEALRKKEQLGTQEMCLQNLYPEKDPTEIKKLANEIEAEKPEPVTVGADGIQGQTQDKSSSAVKNGVQGPTTP